MVPLLESTSLGQSSTEFEATERKISDAVVLKPALEEAR